MTWMTHGGLFNGEHLTHARLSLLTCGAWGLVWCHKAWGLGRAQRSHYR